MNTAGRVLCWSDNDNGLEGRRVNQMDMETVQLKTGTALVPDQNNQPTAKVNLKSLTNAISVDIGENLGCALLVGNSTNKREVACWKYEVKQRQEFDQLWGPYTIQYDPYTAIHISTWSQDNSVRQVAVSDNHACVLLTSGQVQCASHATNSESPDWIFDSAQFAQFSIIKEAGNPLVNISGVSSISAGGDHTCALLRNGKVVCWGSNTNGQLGNNTQINSDDAVEVENLGLTVKSISAGKSHTCAILSDNAAKCWGDNASGQLGDGGMTFSSLPVEVEELTNVRSISAGNEHTCAVLGDNTVKCWGANDKGQLGNLTTSTTPELTPVSVAVEGINKNIRSISVGNKHSCALRNDNTVKCWGGDEPSATP